MKIKQPSEAELSVFIVLNTNSAITAYSEADIVNNALLEYRSKLLKRLIRQTVEEAKGDGDFLELAYDWHVLNTVDQIIVKLTDSLIELAESNYWAHCYLKNRNDYEHIMQSHEEQRQALKVEFLESFGLKKEVGHE